MENIFFLGFDVGGTKIGIGVVDSNGKLYASSRIDNVNTNPDIILPEMVKLAEKLIAQAGLTKNQIAAFGVSTPGPADIPNGIMTRPPNNPQWRNVPILKYLSDHLKITGYFENDANAAALAEGYFGAGRGAKDYAFLTMSTGIGGGFVVDGTLLRGSNFYGGEFGHAVLVPYGKPCNCGQKGCYEAYCGGLAVAMDLQEKLKDQPEHPIIKIAGTLEKVDMKALVQAVRENDAFAVEYYDRMMRYNAQAMGILINTFNPEKIILGTFAWASGDTFMEPLKRHIKDFCWEVSLKNCQIVASELKGDIGYYAGCAAAMYYYNRNHK